MLDFLTVSSTKGHLKDGLCPDLLRELNFRGKGITREERESESTGQEMMKWKREGRQGRVVEV